MSNPGHNDDHPIKITVRTLAGHSDQVTVKPSTLVSAVTNDEVKHFVNKGELTAGDYSLTLPRATNAELDPTATVGSVGVVEGDTLVLVSRKPQSDG